MRRHSYWQVASTVILAILLIVPFSFIKASAATYTANYSLTQYNYYVEKNGTNWATTDIFVNFKGPATGTLTINISPTLSSQYYSFVMISGGNLAAGPTTSTSKLTIGIRSEKTVHIRVQSISTSSNAHATYSMSFSGTYEDGEALSLENIESNLVTLNGKIDTANNVLAQINTKLSNLSIQNYTQILNTINNSIGSVQSAIEDLPDYTSILNSINTYLGSIDVNISDIESICSGIQTSINNILSTLQNIDNLIDTISWTRMINLRSVLKSDNTEFISTGWTGNNAIFLFGLYNYSIGNMLNNDLYFMRLYVDPAQMQYNNIKFYVIDSDFSKHELSTSNLYISETRYFVDLYFTLDNNYYLNGQKYLGISLGSNSLYWYGLTRDSTIRVLSSNDIEYWKLLSTIQQYQFYSGNSQTQQSISEQESTNQSFESQSSQYHQLESTFQSNFDTSFQAINPSDTTSALVQFAPAISWFTAQLGSLYNASGNMKVLFTLPLLLGLAMFFLGRGGKVFDHPERREDHNARDS